MNFLFIYFNFSYLGEGRGIHYESWIVSKKKKLSPNYEKRSGYYEKRSRYYEIIFSELWDNYRVITSKILLGCSSVI